MERVKLQSVLINWVRAITNDGHWNDQQTNDTDLLARWKILDLKSRLNKCRLLYGFQMMQNAPQPLRDSVTAVDQVDQTEWLGAVREAIQWASMLDDSLKPDNCTLLTAEQIVQWFHQHRHHGPAKVRRCAIRHLHLEAQMYQVRKLHQDLCDIAKSKGVVLADVSHPPPLIVDEHTVVLIVTRPSDTLSTWQRIGGKNTAVSQMSDVSASMTYVELAKNVFSPFNDFNNTLRQADDTLTAVTANSLGGVSLSHSFTTLTNPKPSSAFTGCRLVPL